MKGDIMNNIQKAARNLTIQETREAIQELKSSRNTAIFAHHYVPAEIHEFADVLGDSRVFFDAVMAGTNTEQLLVIAPYFFAEIAACLLPDNEIVVPVVSQCPVSNHPNLGFKQVLDFKADNPGIPLLCYATSPLITKLLADRVCIPGEVVSTLNNMKAERVIFVGEQNCAADAKHQIGSKVINYDKNPVCNVYNSANAMDVVTMKARYPSSCFLVHPESRLEVIDRADYVMGTGEIHKFINNNPQIDTFVLGTELGFCERMQSEFPNRTIVHLSPFLICNTFKVFRMSTLLYALKNGGTSVQVDRVLANRVAELFRKEYCN
jgi:quinolinate synthase